MTQDPNEQSAAGIPRTGENPGDEGRVEAVREQSGGANVVERPDRSRVQESEDDGALGLTRTGQDG